ncbi:type II toxin-antitoxin system RelE/ParE family toxin [Rhodoferax sp.]|nr:type II toxin-antitoxin system RelE/ParE family toxin [Rhodoferax sp.]
MVLFYDEPGLVRIVRVMHGAMDIEAQFAEKNGGTDSNPT